MCEGNFAGHGRGGAAEQAGVARVAEALAARDQSDRTRAVSPLTLAAAAFCFVAPEFLTSATFDAPALFWLGLGTRETLTQDWRPFFPWAGALLLGVAVARATCDADDEARALLAAFKFPFRN